MNSLLGLSQLYFNLSLATKIVLIHRASISQELVSRDVRGPQGGGGGAESASCGKRATFPQLSQPATVGARASPNAILPHTVLWHTRDDILH